MMMVMAWRYILRRQKHRSQIVLLWFRNFPLSLFPECNIRLVVVQIEIESSEWTVSSRLFCGGEVGNFKWKGTKCFTRMSVELIFQFIVLNVVLASVFRRKMWFFIFICTVCKCVYPIQTGFFFFRYHKEDFSNAFSFFLYIYIMCRFT